MTAGAAHNRQYAAPISAVMSLFCCTRGSFPAWELWWVTSEGE